MGSMLRMKGGYLEVSDKTFPNLLSSRFDSLEVIGHSINITKTKEVQELIERSGESLEKSYFTANERSIYRPRAEPERCIEYLAGRLAAKEAVLRALGKKRCENTSWLDIEIKRLSTGEPSIVLYGKCQQIAVNLGVRKWLVSISHESSYAAASAIALGRCDKQF